MNKLTIDCDEADKIALEKIQSLPRKIKSSFVCKIVTQ